MKLMNTGLDGNSAPDNPGASPQSYQPPQKQPEVTNVIGNNLTFLREAAKGGRGGRVELHNRHRFLRGPVVSDIPYISLQYMR